MSSIGKRGMRRLVRRFMRDWLRKSEEAYMRQLLVWHVEDLRKRKLTTTNPER